MPLGLAPSATGALGLACADGSFAQQEIATTRGAIVNGRDSDPSQDAVVLLIALDGTGGAQVSGQCSGTLVAPDLVLTARHCVSRAADGPFACDESGRLLPGSRGGTLGADHPAAGLLVFSGASRPDFASGAARPAARGARIFHDGATVVCGHDLALLSLDAKLGETPIAPLRLAAPPILAELVTAVGWGTTATTSEPAVRQQRSGIAITRVGPAPPVTDGDGGLVERPVPPDEFEVGEATCWGDSGGPALSGTTGAVVGVTSAGGNGRGASRNEPGAGCAGPETFNVFSTVSSFQPVVLQAFAAVGAQPWLEGEPAPPTTVDRGGCAVGAGRPTAAPIALVAASAALAALAAGGRHRRRVAGPPSVRRPAGANPLAS